MPRDKYSNIVARCCSTSYNKELPADELCAVLTGKKPIGEEWMFHFSTLFNEVPCDFLVGTMRELGIDLDDVDRVFDMLPALLQGKQFKEFSRRARNMENPF